MSNFFDQIADHAGQIVGGTVGAIYGGPQGAYEGYQLGGDAQDVFEGKSNPITGGTLDNTDDSSSGLSQNPTDWVNYIANIAKNFDIFS